MIKFSDRNSSLDLNLIQQVDKKALSINSSTSEILSALLLNMTLIFYDGLSTRKSDFSIQFDLRSNLHFFSRIITCCFAHLNFFVYTHPIRIHSRVTARRTSPFFLFDHVSLKREITQVSKISGMQIRIYLN